MKRNTFILILSLIVIGIAGRLMVHIPNATPLTALAFAGGMFISRKAAFLLPIAVLLITDLFIGFYSWGVMLGVYGSVALIALMSWWLRKNPSILRVGSATIASSLLFYIITNAAVWYTTPWYAKTITGLLYSYELGLPFLRNMMLGDMFYVTVIVGGLALAPKIATHYKEKNNKQTAY